MVDVFTSGAREYEKYLYVLDVVPAVPGINTEVGPNAGDSGKLSIIIQQPVANNVFTFQASTSSWET